jgi:hypothetical protein
MANELIHKNVPVAIVIKVKSIAMQTVRIVQAVILMIIVALAASCAASKEYTSKLFAPRTPIIKDSIAIAAIPRFLNIDSSEDNQEGWVTTDIIMGRADTTVNTIALDNLAQNFPAKKDSLTIVAKTENTKSITATESKDLPEETVPVAKTSRPGSTRNKRTRE